MKDSAARSRPAEEPGSASYKNPYVVMSKRFSKQDLSQTTENVVQGSARKKKKSPVLDVMNSSGFGGGIVVPREMAKSQMNVSHLSERVPPVNYNF